jgi:hypothetical protein
LENKDVVYVRYVTLLNPGPYRCAPDQCLLVAARLSADRKVWEGPQATVGEGTGDSLQSTLHLLLTN